MKSLALSILAITSFFSVSSQAQTAFTTSDSIGRLVYVKDGSTKHYIGYFCLARSKVENHTTECLQSQFGMGEDIIRATDFLGNPSNDLGSWKALGPVFTADSGRDFYNNALQSRGKDAFLEVWQDILLKEGYNWTSDPVKLSKSTWNSFLNLLTANSDLPTETRSTREIKKLLAGSNWKLSPWHGVLRFTSSYSDAEMCITIDTTSDKESQYLRLPNYNQRTCFREADKTLTYNEVTHTFRALGVDKNFIEVKVVDEQGLIFLTLKMTIPAGAISTNIEKNSPSWYYYSAQTVELKLTRESN